MSDVKVTANTAEIMGNVRTRGGVMLRSMLDDIDRTSGPATPRRTGDLRQRKLKQVLGLHASIAWLVNYAIFQELKQFSKYTTPGTGPHFADKSVKAVANRTSEHAREAGLA